MSAVERAASPSQQAIINAIENQTILINAKIIEQTKVIDDMKTDIVGQGVKAERQYRKWCKYKKLSFYMATLGLTFALSLSIVDYIRSGDQSLISHAFKFLKFML